ncbi:ERAD-associated E3 ubiquitin-protein ligase ASI1 [Nakaseomyces bracarensis]|uniref:ERAD-associated E3 ubiquitin-protein ligase ASI1 n=1 Tax=Nakaseomyces bracarensis TaxID=273131 RepID=A0ABR4NV78_9SACH
MNSTFDELFPYLNQSTHHLLPGNNPVVKFPNVLYRLALSFYDAIESQYVEVWSEQEISSTLRSFNDIVGFFFSEYSVLCFTIAVLLNRFISIISRRNRLNRTNLRPEIGLLSHLSCIMILGWVMFDLLSRLVLAQMYKKDVISPPLSLYFILFSWSYCVETVISLLSNSSPLEGSDYTIFEISIEFYLLQRKEINIAEQVEYLPDCVMAIANRIMIHILEMHKLRKYRLLGSTLLNLGHISYLFFIYQTKGLQGIPMLTKFRHFPKMFSLFIVIISLISYLLAYIVRFDPFGNSYRNPDELQFHSFMKNWRKHLNFTGEEDFSPMLSKLAILLTSGSSVSERGTRYEYPSVKLTQKLYKSYAKRLSTVQSLEDQKRLSEDSCNRRSSIVKLAKPILEAPRNIPFISNTIDSLKLVATHLNEIFKGNEEEYDNAIEDYDEDDEEEKKETGLRRYSISKDTGWLSEYNDDEQDYVPKEEDDDEDGDEEEYTDDIVELRDDIMELIRDDFDPIAYKDHLHHRLRPLSESSSSLSEEEFDYSCVVCKTNDRNIILWPCSCFALCDDCRVSLSLRGFNTCVCCRCPVNGYSKSCD